MNIICSLKFVENNLLYQKIKRNTMSTMISQHFHNKSYIVDCYWLLLVSKKVILVIDLN